MSFIINFKIAESKKTEEISSLFNIKFSNKTNISFNETELNLERLDDIKIDSNFALIKCYKLAFGWEGKLKNYGFWIFTILLFLFISLLIIYCFKGMKSIQKHIINEMKDNGYIKNEINNINFLKLQNEKKSGPPKKQINNTVNKKWATLAGCPLFLDKNLDGNYASASAGAAGITETKDLLPRVFLNATVPSTNA